MNFLAVNTAGESVEVALKVGDKEYFAFDSEYKKASEVLLPLIDEVLSRAGAELADMDFFACCIGPGSFTGIRIGLSTIRAVCQSLGKPAVAVTDLLELSYNETRLQKTIALSDAGNGYTYAAVYDEKRGEVVSPTCIAAQCVQDFLNTQKKPYSVCCDALSAKLCPNACLRKIGGNALIKAVEHELSEAGTKDYKLLEPLYVRKSQAEQQLEESGNK